ncbi:MAG: hypothetical protein J7L88_06295 [Thermoplasmata archaeon]|nr:hypothetical protein [Thermoplasmata archaeon]
MKSRAGQRAVVIAAFSILLLAAFYFISFGHHIAEAAGNETAGGGGSLSNVDNLELFLYVFLLSFGIGAIILGAFTAYFGSGKSRVFGASLTIGGLLVYLCFIYFRFVSEGDDTLLGLVHWSAVPFLKVFLVVLGFIIGLVVALVLFLVGIIKS